MPHKHTPFDGEFRMNANRVPEEAITVMAPVKLTQDEEGLVVRFGMTPDQARVQSAKNKESRRQQWLETAIDPWAKKHGISRMQAISVLFCDNTTEGVTDKDAYWVEGNDFSGATMVAAKLNAWVPLGAQPTHKTDALAVESTARYEALEIEIKRLQKIEAAASKLLVEVGKADGMTAGHLTYRGAEQPSEDWLKAFSGQRRKMWEASEDLRGALGGQPSPGAQHSNSDAEDQKIVIVIEDGMVRSVLAAEGGFSVAVIEYDKNADMDNLVVIPQGDGEKNAYALAAIHEPDVTPAARVNELYSAVVEAKPAAEDEDSPRPRL